MINCLIKLSFDHKWSGRCGGPNAVDAELG